jgi:hypothetical protein
MYGAVHYLLAVLIAFLVRNPGETPKSSQFPSPDLGRTEKIELLDSAIVNRNQEALKELVCIGLLLTILLKRCSGPSPGWLSLPCYGLPI